MTKIHKLSPYRPTVKWKGPRVSGKVAYREPIFLDTESQGLASTGAAEEAVDHLNVVANPEKKQILCDLGQKDRGIRRPRLTTLPKPIKVPSESFQSSWIYPKSLTSHSPIWRSFR